jgi:predicted MFS family arabinose efflux permease
MSGVPLRIEIRTILLLGLAWGFAFFDRMTMSFLSPFVAKDLDLSNLEIGALGSGLSISWALAAYLIGRWSDSIGRRKPFLLTMLVIFGACSILSGLSWNFESLLASRVIMGAAEGPFLPVCLAIIAAYSAPQRRGLNTGIVQNGFGSLLGNALAPIVVIAMAVAWGWRTSFMLAGLPGIILAILIWRYVDEPPRPTAPEQDGVTAGGLFPLAMLKVRNIWLLCLISTCMIGTMVLGSIFLPLYFVNERGLSPTTMGNLMAVLGICPAVGGVLVPWLSDRIGRRLPMILFCLLTAICPLAAITFDGSLVLLGAIIFISWIGIGVGPLFMGVIPAESLTPRLAATAMGLVVCVGELTGGFLGPLIGGWAANEAGLAMPLLLQAALAVGAGLLSFGLVETRPRSARVALAAA